MPAAGIADRTKVLPKKVGVTVFPAEIYRHREFGGSVPSATSSTGTRLIRGGHFAAWELPEIFSQDLRAAVRSLRDQEVE